MNKNLYVGGLPYSVAATRARRCRAVSVAQRQNLLHLRARVAADSVGGIVFSCYLGTDFHLASVIRTRSLPWFRSILLLQGGVCSATTKSAASPGAGCHNGGMS